MLNLTLLRQLGAALLLLTAGPLRASHLCGAELYYDLHAGGSIDFELHVYAASATNPTSLTLDPADGSLVTLTLTDLDTIAGSCCSFRLEYTGSHVYVSPGLYYVSVDLVTTRSADLMNIMNPTMQSLCVLADILVPDLNTDNSSVRFTEPQSVTYFVGNTLTHEVGAYDADGDSLTFLLGVPRGTNCAPISPYQTPHQVGGGNDTSWVDAGTGNFLFQNPWLLGSHVLLIRAREWRNGVLLGNVDRDMKLCVNGTTAVIAPSAPERAALVPAGTPGVFSLASTAATACHVIDATGRTVNSTVVQPQRMLDLRALRSGTYTVVLDSGASVRTQRLSLVY